MLPSIVSLLFGCATTIERKPTPPGEQPKAKPGARSPAASKGTSCAKSTPHSAQQNQLKFLLDEHKRINAAIETFFKIIKAKLVWRRTREMRRQAKLPSSNIPTASITRTEAIHHWEAKALWPTNAKQLKKAVGGA
jgi:hypothetical protein